MDNPFKPGSGLYPPYFAGRKREEDAFTERLDQTMSGTPMHMAILGDWAAGKTSLLEKFREIAENRNFVVCGIITPSTDSTNVFVNSISKAIADEIRLKGGGAILKKLKDRVSEISGVQASVFGFGASIEMKEAESTPQIDLKVGLRTVWNEFENRHKGLIILIDDFDLITENESKRKQIMLTLRNGLMEAIRDGARIMCVVTGAKLFEQFEVAHGPLVRFFEPYEIGQLEMEEARKAIMVPLKGTGIEFTQDCINKVLDITDCNPYYIQEFCYHLFKNALNGRVNMTVFESTYNTVLHDLGRKMWREKVHDLGDVALKISNLIVSGCRSTQEIIDDGRKKFDLTPGTVRGILSRMQSRGQIQRVGRGEYILKDKLFGEYVKTLF